MQKPLESLSHRPREETPRASTLAGEYTGQEPAPTSSFRRNRPWEVSQD